MRSPPSQDDDETTHQYCKAVFQEDSNKGIEGAPNFSRKFLITCQFEDIPFRERESSCWLNLVSFDAVIAKGFPVPQRQEEKGIEIPLAVLAQMAGIQHAVEFMGGFVMKGPTSMLVPISRNADIIQWHLVSSPNHRQRLSYAEGVSQCRHRALVDQVSLEALYSSRAIVGWWRQARTRLGDEDVDYEGIDYSTAKDYAPAVKISNISAGFQQFGTAQIEFVLGRKDFRFHMKWAGAYEDMLIAAKNMRILLYDTGEKRAWLVSGDEVILHIIRKRGSMKPFIVNGEKVRIPCADSAEQSLLRNRKLVLIDDDEKPETLRSMASRYFDILEYLLALNVEKRQQPQTPVGIPFQDDLLGYEFMAVVDRRMTGHLKKYTLSKTSGGWIKLVEDSDALVLLASGFKDLICPAEDANGLCHTWRTLPKEKDYLATKRYKFVRILRRTQVFPVFL
nr:uncharacterized protein CTRU02_06160 [Colletotrichum truncatum]KAF6793288.1 hypothetical protein CTRU02_06160 [Colletotrichum truncatum]